MEIDIHPSLRTLPLDKAFPFLKWRLQQHGGTFRCVSCHSKLDFGVHPKALVVFGPAPNGHRLVGMSHSNCLASGTYPLTDLEVTGTIHPQVGLVGHSQNGQPFLLISHPSDIVLVHSDGTMNDVMLQSMLDATTKGIATYDFAEVTVLVDEPPPIDPAFGVVLDGDTWKVTVFDNAVVEFAAETFPDGVESFPGPVVPIIWSAQVPGTPGDDFTGVGGDIIFAALEEIVSLLGVLVTTAEVHRL